MCCARVPAALCVTCSQDFRHNEPLVQVPWRPGCAEGAMGDSNPANSKRSGRRCGWGSQGLRNPCRLRPHRPRLRIPPPAQQEALAPPLVNGAARLPAPQQFYIGDDEAYCCSGMDDTLPLVSGTAWQSAPGLRSNVPELLSRPSAPAPTIPLALRDQQDDELSPVERAQLISQVRRQLNGLSENSRHLVTAPTADQLTDRGGSSTGGTFREFFTLQVCTSEDITLAPPSCLEARRRLPEAPAAGAVPAAPDESCKGAVRVTAMEAKAQEEDKWLELDPPLLPTVFDDEFDEDPHCERYNVSRLQDGRLIWSPEPLPAG